MKLSKSEPILSHLFFADDSLIFCKAEESEVEELMRILKVYENASAQLINLEKSSILFSSNTPEIARARICRQMGSIQMVKQGKYLGLPVVITRSKEQIFHFIKEKVTSLLGNYKIG